MSVKPEEQENRIFGIDIRENKTEVGKHFYRSILICDGKSVSIESSEFDPDDKEARRFALDSFFSNIGFALRQKFVPEHTQVWDFIKEENGGYRLVNPRYPEDEPNQKETYEI